jgi:hypothetical protein
MTSFLRSSYDRTIDFLKKIDFPRKAGAFDRNIDVLGEVAQCGAGRPSRRGERAVSARPAPACRLGASLHVGIAWLARQFKNLKTLSEVSEVSRLRFRLRPPGRRPAAAGSLYNRHVSRSLTHDRGRPPADILYTDHSLSHVTDFMSVMHVTLVGRVGGRARHDDLLRLVVQTFLCRKTVLRVPGCLQVLSREF